MRNKLMVTAAVAALIGYTSFAAAQEPSKGEPGKGATHAQEHAAPGGAMQHAQPGGAMQHQPPAGGAEPSHGAQNEPKPGVNGKPGPENAQTQERTRTEEKAQTQERTRTEEKAQTQERTQEHNGRTEENAQSQPRPGQAPENNRAAAPGNEREHAAQGKGPAGGHNVQISEQQRTQIKDIIVRDHNVPRVDHVDFSVQVGVMVPRSVHFAVLPTEIVDIVPEYRGFDYVVVGDQLLIIDPQTLEIVYILPA